MAKPQQQKVLYFIRGATPGDAARKRADSLPRDVNVCFRNVNVYREGDSLEHCDAVMGHPPKAYLERFGKYAGETPVKATKKAATQTQQTAPQAPASTGGDTDETKE